MATGCLSAPLEPADHGPGDLRGDLAVHERVAARSTRPHRQARRPRRHRLVGRAGDARDRARRGRALRVPAHAVVRVAGGQQAARRRPAGEGEGAVPRPAGRAAQELRRCRRHERRGRGAPAARRRHPRGHAGGTSGGGRRAGLGGVPGLERRAARPRRQRGRGRALPRDGAAGRRRPRDRRRTLAARSSRSGASDRSSHTDYYETFNRDHVHLVDLRRGGIEEITPDGIQTEQGFFDARRDRVRHRVRRHDRRAVPHRHPRARRPAVARRLGRRCPHAPRRPDRRVPELLHHHRAGEPVGAREHGRVRGAAHRVDRRAAHVHARPRPHAWSSRRWRPRTRGSKR